MAKGYLLFSVNQALILEPCTYQDRDHQVISHDTDFISGLSRQEPNSFYSIFRLFMFVEPW